MNVADLLGLVALLTKTVDTARFAAKGHINGLVTQLLAWGVGVGGVFAVAQTQWASHIAVGNGGTLSGQGALSLVAIGLAASSSGSVLNDLRSALDNTNTAIMPPLIGKAIGSAKGVFVQAQSTVVPSQVHEFTEDALVQIEGVLSHVLGKKIGAAFGLTSKVATSDNDHTQLGPESTGGSSTAGAHMAFPLGGSPEPPEAPSGSEVSIGGAPVDAVGNVFGISDMAPEPPAHDPATDVHPDFHPAEDTPAPPPLTT